MHIFLSHSQHDKELCEKFLANCGLAGIQGVAFEFDVQSGRVPLDRAAAEVIRETIETARALFVIIGPNVVATFHTSNWVAFEIGVAFTSQPTIPIWVFEDNGQYVDFPVPALMHHALFNPTSEKEWDWIRGVMEVYAQKPSLFSSVRDPLADMATVCPYINCRAVYQHHYPGDITSWKCPSCRQLLNLVVPGMHGYERSGPIQP